MIAIVFEDPILFDRMRIRFARMPMQTTSNFVLYPSRSAFMGRDRQDIRFLAYQGDCGELSTYGMPYARIGIDGDNHGGATSERLIPIIQPIDSFLSTLLEMAGKTQVESKLRMMRICYREQETRHLFYSAVNQAICDKRSIIMDWMPVSIDDFPNGKGDRLLAYQCLRGNHSGLSDTELTRIGSFAVFRTIANEFDFGIAEELLSPQFYKACQKAGYEVILSFEYIGMAPIWPVIVEGMDERIIVISTRDMINAEEAVRCGVEEMLEWIGRK